MELESGLKKDGQMKRARFTEEQIIAVLKEHEAGTKTADLARKHGISEATIYNWKARFGGMDVSEAKRLKALEEENAKLSHLGEPSEFVAPLGRQAGQKATATFRTSRKHRASHPQIVRQARQVSPRPECSWPCKR